jgi:uncharacterized protein (TIGR02145 family)
MVVMVLTMALIFSCSSGDDDEGDKDNGGSKGNDIANYKTKTIGTQTWMAENMNHAVSDSKCYENKPANCDKYGRLYDWATAMTVCPSGWHLPSDEDWDILMNYVQTDNGRTYTSGSHASIAGKYLKATSGWNYGGQSWNGEDKYGFAALPGSYSNSGGSYVIVGKGGHWWSSTEDGSGNAYRRYMDYDIEGVGRVSNWKSFMFSVRCVQN